MRGALLLAGLLLLPAMGPARARADAASVKDVEAALDACEAKCGDLLRRKRIDWKKVRAELLPAAAAADSTQARYEVLVRLVARLRDGHARVEVAKGTGEVRWPGPSLERGPGMAFCVSGPKVLVKEASGSAAAAGIGAGDEVVSVDGVPARKWLDARVEELSRWHSHSTDAQALHFACHWGLGGPAGSTMDLEVRAPRATGTRKVPVPRTSGGLAPRGPAAPPAGLESLGRQSYGRTPKGFAYVHLRDVPDDLPAQLDAMLAKIGDAPGLVLDGRGNGGGGCDHDAVFGRFLPTGTSFGKSKRYESAGPNPYAGPVVLVLDAGIRSAGETVFGMLKEDGRAYAVGESSTAGMSSSKETIPLPSGAFSLFVSVRSNMHRLNGGEGIEGLGIAPHETLAYDAADLAAGRDTLLERAEALLAKFPKEKVPYRPPAKGR